MNSRLIRIVFAFLCLVAVSGLSASAQGRPPGGAPGGPPPGGPPPGGPGPGGSGPGGPGGPPSALKSPRQNAGATHSSLRLGPVGRWWDDKSVVQTIGLRKEQQQRMDTIFNANKPAILSSYKSFLSEQAKLDALNKDPQVDKGRLFAAIDAVSQARASLQKATSQMLLQIRQEMDPGQVTKLEKLE
jgi:Spy/CpxP family protein refolding chaperone